MKKINKMNSKPRLKSARSPPPLDGFSNYADMTIMSFWCGFLGKEVFGLMHFTKSKTANCFLLKTGFVILELKLVTRVCFVSKVSF